METEERLHQIRLRQQQLGVHLNHLCEIIDQLSSAFLKKFSLKKIKLQEWKNNLSVNNHLNLVIKNTSAVPTKRKTSAICKATVPIFLKQNFIQENKSDIVAV